MATLADILGQPTKYQPVACAVVDETGNVVNMIMADPAGDRAPKGCALLPIPDGAAIDQRWSVAVGGFEPRMEYAAEMLSAEGKALDAVAVEAPASEPV